MSLTQDGRKLTFCDVVDVGKEEKKYQLFFSSTIYEMLYGHNRKCTNRYIKLMKINSYMNLY